VNSVDDDLFQELGGFVSQTLFEDLPALHFQLVHSTSQRKRAAG
jgi:hypothetical protein